MDRSVANIIKVISELPKTKQNDFKRIFLVSVFDSEMDAPKEKVIEWGQKYRGIENLKKQRIVRIDNLITNESTLFNSLRASRPMQKSSEEINLEEGGKDDFCNPLTATPSDMFGRVRGKSTITASNLMKYDCYHDVVIFNEHNPLNSSYETLSDAIDVGLRWFEKVQKIDKEAVYPFLIWNCLWRAGASIIHGHLQVTLTKKRHYPKAELIKKVLSDYKRRYKRDYFNDLYGIHEALDIAFCYKDVKVISYITPIKEKEVIILSKKMNDNLKETVYKVVRCFREELGVKSFNVAVIMPPLNGKWKDFPCIVRIVDRGDLNNKTSDIGAMELYSGSSVVAADPFNIARILKESFKK